MHLGRYPLQHAVLGLVHWWMVLRQRRTFTVADIHPRSPLLAGISHLLHQRHGDGLEAGEVLHQWLQGDAWHELDEEVKELGGEEERGMGHVAT